MSGSGSRRCHGSGRTLTAMLTRRAAVVGAAAAAVLAVTACQPLDTGASGSHSTVKSGSHSTVKSGKTTKKSGKVVVRLETKKGNTTMSRQSVTVRSGSVARVTSSGNGHVSCRIVFNGQTVASKTGTGAVTCSATVTH